MSGYKRRVKTFERRLDIGAGPNVIKIPPPPPAINPGAIERAGFPRLAGETDQEYLARYNAPGPEGWIYKNYMDCGGNVKIAFPVRSGTGQA